MYIEKVEEKKNAGKVVHTCPYCKNQAVFFPIGTDIQISQKYCCGQRVCPSCKGHVFVTFEWSELYRAYPPLRIDFDSTDIPASVVTTFSEALSCHAQNCFVSAAIMVRRTLEEICEDRGATGGNLKARVSSLKGKVVLPDELFEAMDELRLLGNDAAHIEARTYEKIGTEELETAIEFTKEIMKGVYQYKGLLSKLRSLKQQNQAEQDAVEQPSTASESSDPLDTNA